AFIGDPGAPILIEGFGDVVVKNEDWCTSLTKCDGEINLPQVVLNPVPNGYNGRDICTDRPEGGDPLEGVQVFWNEDLSITTDICYNSYQERVWCSDTSPLNINYTLAICDQNVPSGVNLIDDWTGLDNGLTCDQLEDIFRAMTIYGGRAMPPLPGYYLRVVINAHENEHKIDYQTAIDQALPEFNQTLQNYIKHCVDFNDKESAKLVFSKFISQSFSKLKENSKNNIKKIKKSGNNRSLDYETDVQRRRSVIDEINRQISATNTAWNCNILLIDYFY
ncbi:MAG TPA: hypothetical protein PKE38_17265, partial [Ignavibacteriaceae bacterium]|nr:hypothetical protein [Ignavibacteriaceae bacterium]